MSRFEVRITTSLDVTPQTAWDYLMSHDEWRLPFVTSVTKLTNGDIEVGSRFENVIRGGGRTWTAINQMTRVEAPRRLTWKQTNKDGPTATIEGSYLLAPADAGTEFTLHTVQETTGWGSGPAWLNRWVLVHKVYPTFLRQLRQAVGDEIPSPHGHAPRVA